MKPVKLLILLLIAILCVSTVSCDLFELESRAYQGGKVVGFRLQSRQIEAADADTAAYTIKLEVQLIRSKEGVLNKPLPVHFVVVDTITTATSPDDYKILTPSPIIIPAGSLKTYLKLRVNGSGIPTGQARILVIQLTGNESRGVKGGVNIGRYELTIANTE